MLTLELDDVVLPGDPLRGARAAVRRQRRGCSVTLTPLAGGGAARRAAAPRRRAGLAVGRRSTLAPGIWRVTAHADGATPVSDLVVVADAMTLGWSEDLLVLDGDAPAAASSQRCTAAGALGRCERAGGACATSSAVGELLDRLRRPLALFDPTRRDSLSDVLRPHECARRAGPPARRWRTVSRQPARHAGPRAAPRRGRAVRRDRAVGGVDVGAARRAGQRESTRGARPRRSDPWRHGAVGRAAARRCAVGAGRRRGRRLDVGLRDRDARQRHRPRARRAGERRSRRAAPSRRAPPAAADDEGTTPVRHPSIEPAGALRPGAPVTLVVDLLRDASPTPRGGAARPRPPRPPTGARSSIGVTLVLADDRLRRQRPRPRSRSGATPHRPPAQLSGRVHDDAGAGAEIEVNAQFWAGTRCSGRRSALRVCGGGGARWRTRRARAATPVPRHSAGGGGDHGLELRVEPHAEPPDLTVFITLFDRDRPGPHALADDDRAVRRAAAEARWCHRSRPRPGEPRRRRCSRSSPTSSAASISARIEGFGEKLWDSAPAEFRAVYWALHDHYRASAVDPVRQRRPVPAVGADASVPSRRDAPAARAAPRGRALDRRAGRATCATACAPAG